MVMLSTIHDNSFVTKKRRSRTAPDGQEDIIKPLVVEEYNKNMGGVDTGQCHNIMNMYVYYIWGRVTEYIPQSLFTLPHLDVITYYSQNTGDQLESYYGFSHRTVKWWRRLFFHLIDMAIVNTYILYLMSPCSGRRLTHAQFHIELAKQLLMEVVTPADEPTAEQPHGPRPDPSPPSSRLTERHFPDKLGLTAAGHQHQPDCIICSKRKGRRRKSTAYECKQCHLPMCVIPCFELYHTKTHPERYL